MDKLEGILNHVLNWELLEMTLSNRKCPGDIKRIKVRPVIIKDRWLSILRLRSFIKILKRIRQQCG